MVRQQRNNGATHGAGASSGQRGSQRQNINISRTFQGRQFGGQLTTGDADGAVVDGLAAAASQLQADAPEFRPGQSQAQQTTARRTPNPPRQRQRRASKSTAPDIATRIHEDIDNGQYECAICTNEVLRNSRSWSCRTCWTVFHLSCIKKWSTNEGSAMAQPQPHDGDLPPPRRWRCPGCNLPKNILPSASTCWCKKEIDPRSLTGLPPFSCGQTCSRPHTIPKKCPHPCPALCHAGPCPPCAQMGPTQSCFCGKESVTRRCVDTDYEDGWSCGQICGEAMPCGAHSCGRSCHEGLCGACEVPVESRCYCGQVEKPVVCCERGEEVLNQCTRSADSGATTVEEWTGSFVCGNTCNRTFDCGKHHCEKPCHAQQAKPPHCPRSPDVVSHCPCGKTPLKDVSDAVRRSCEDPVPNCSKSCLKPLPCGHPCEQVCHSGECTPCLKKGSIMCRCGRMTSSTICHQGVEVAPQCMRVCRVTLNCGRHECGERCCPGERKAAERQANKRKPRPLNSAPRPVEDGFEAEHICTRPCGRLLKCGNHTCQELCHKGPCGNCREAIFDEISCNCGRTVLQPPLPCGTKPPPCRFECERAKACGHPQVPHNCHQDDESCPKCPFLTMKLCLCGKNQLKNQPCWLTEVRCGGICGRKLRCGAHKCRKPCHKPGECEDAGRACQQPCGKERSCGHACTEPCHSPFSCKEDRPCPATIYVTCDCQRIKQEAKCTATRDSEGKPKKALKCDDECARLERNRKLALALSIDPEAHKDDYIPYSADTLGMFQQNVQWACVQERDFRAFAADPNEKRLRFKPMPGHQRAFLHALAEDFGFDSESMDPEPHRHVSVFKTPRFVTAPVKTLAECVRVRHNQRAATAVTVEAQQKRASNVVGDPYNAFLVTSARFGLTIEELRSATRPALAAEQNLNFEISFLPSEEVVLKASTTASPSTERELETQLISLKPALTKLLSMGTLGKIQLCRVDSYLNIQRRESDSMSNSGWSQVAAKAAAPMKVPRQMPVGTKSSFAVLSGGGGKVTLGKKKKAEPKKEESVVDDWEAAELMEEEKERGASGASGDEEIDRVRHDRQVGSMNAQAEAEKVTESSEGEHEASGASALDWTSVDRVAGTHET